MRSSISSAGKEPKPRGSSQRRFRLERGETGGEGESEGGGREREKGGEKGEGKERGEGCRE